jgi:uncharacterized protein YaiI (UPF0178 family)
MRTKPQLWPQSALRAPGVAPSVAPVVSLYIDADACPVKDEVYRVAVRYGLPVFVVSNSWIRTPPQKLVTSIVVEEGPDVADDWIAERAGPADVVITADIPLAHRVLSAGGQAIHPGGRVFTADNIGAALASRGIGEHLRSMGEITGGPKPFTPADRSKFLQSLDAAVVRARRR